MSSAPIERRVIKASVLRPTQEKLRTLAEEHGCTQQALFGRVLDWFAAMPKGERAMIVSGLSEREIASLGKRVGKRKR
jgi:transcription termination factor Rho